LADEVRPGQSDADVTISIFGELSAAPAAVSNTAFDLSTRTPTAANVMWQPESSTVTHEILTTPNIADIVNEIVALPGWAAGNDLMVLFGHTSGAGCRWIEAASDGPVGMTPALSYTTSGAGCGGSCATADGTSSITGRGEDSEEKVLTGVIDPTSSDLELVHEGSGTGDNQQIVLLVFPAVGIPPGSSIASASILFDIDEVRPGQSDADCTIAIYGEANISPAAPSTAVNDISSRTPTSSAVVWQPYAHKQPTVACHS